MKLVKRLVTLDDACGKSRAIAEGAVTDVREDPAQPGVVSSVIWATEGTPARVTTQVPAIAPDFAPPPAGSVCRIVTFPSDPGGRPPMRAMRSLDFCLVLEGEITLV